MMSGNGKEAVNIQNRQWHSLFVAETAVLTSLIVGRSRTCQVFSSKLFALFWFEDAILTYKSDLFQSGPKKSKLPERKFLRSKAPETSI